MKYKYIMKGYLTVFFLLLCFASFAQEKRDFYILHTFSINGVKVNLNDNFQIYYVCQFEDEKLIYRPKIHGDTIFISSKNNIHVFDSLIKKKKSNWVLVFNDTAYSFSHIRLNDLKNGSRYHLTRDVFFYRSDYEYYSIKDNYKDVIKQDDDGYIYVIIDGMFGISECIPIQHLKTYFEEGNRLLNIRPTATLPVRR